MTILIILEGLKVEAQPLPKSWETELPRLNVTVEGVRMGQIWQEYWHGDYYWRYTGDGGRPTAEDFEDILLGFARDYISRKEARSRLAEGLPDDDIPY